MATSGSTDYSLTARQVVDHALKLIRELDGTQSASGADAKEALVSLNLMLKSWQHSGPHIFRDTFGSLTLTDATASYALNPQPYRVVEARYRDTAGRDIPMFELGRQEYVDLPLKAATGVPTQYYVDYQRGATNLYVWPVLATATTESVQYTFQRRFEDVDSLNEEIDVPQECLDLVAYNLADRLLDLFGKDIPRITQRAALLKQQSEDEEREDFVQFVPAEGWR